MITQYDLISQALAAAGKARPLPVEPETGLCCITGLTRQTIPRKLLLKDGFTELDCLRAVHSDRVSVECWNTLTHAPERLSSWFCDGEAFQQLEKSIIRERVFDRSPAKKPWVGYVTTSFKKHGALHVPVNHGRSSRWRFETLTVDCTDKALVRSTFRRLLDVRKAGVPRGCIETMSFSPYAIGLLGAKKWLDFEQWARGVWRSGLYQFLTYLLPSQDELNAAKK